MVGDRALKLMSKKDKLKRLVTLLPRLALITTYLIGHMSVEGTELLLLGKDLV